MRLSLRFLVPLVIAIGVFAYVAVPLADTLMLRWFVRDLDIRSSLIATTKSNHTLAIIRAAYQDPKPADWLAGRTGVPAVTLPYTVGGDAQSKDLFGLFDSTLGKLLGAAK